MIEEKDTEISRLLDDNKNLRQSLESKPPVCLLSTPFGYNFLMYFVLSVFCTHFVMFQFTGKRRFLLCMWNRWVAEKG